MFEVRQILTRMRLGDTDRAIARAGLKGRRKLSVRGRPGDEARDACRRRERHRRERGGPGFAARTRSGARARQGPDSRNRVCEHDRDERPADEDVSSVGVAHPGSGEGRRWERRAQGSPARASGRGRTRPGACLEDAQRVGVEEASSPAPAGRRAHFMPLGRWAAGPLGLTMRARTRACGAEVKPPSDEPRTLSRSPRPGLGAPGARLRAKRRADPPIEPPETRRTVIRIARPSSTPLRTRGTHRTPVRPGGPKLSWTQYLPGMSADCNTVPEYPAACRRRRLRST